MYGVPRGLQLNNPGNVKLSGIAWSGAVTPSSDPIFCQFEDINHGIRAAALIFLNYHRLDGLSTVAQYIARWAPSGDDNPVASYVAFVASHCGVGADDQYDVTDGGNLCKLLGAVFEFEQGYPAIDPTAICQVVSELLPSAPLAVS